MSSVRLLRRSNIVWAASLAAFSRLLPEALRRSGSTRGNSSALPVSAYISVWGSRYRTGIQVACHDRVVTADGRRTERIGLLIGERRYHPEILLGETGVRPGHDALAGHRNIDHHGRLRHGINPPAIRHHRIAYGSHVEHLSVSRTRTNRQNGCSEHHPNLSHISCFFVCLSSSPAHCAPENKQYKSNVF